MTKERCMKEADKVMMRIEESRRETSDGREREKLLKDKEKREGVRRMRVRFTEVRFTHVFEIRNTLCGCKTLIIKYIQVIVRVYSFDNVLHVFVPLHYCQCIYNLMGG